jgi:hypothetical protein
MTPRLWNIVFHFHADATATVFIHVDARLLLPSCDSRSAAQALGYVEAVLVDSRAEDTLALRVQGVTASPHYVRAKSAIAAMGWLRERVSELERTALPADARSHSATLPVVRDADISARKPKAG